MQFIVVIALFVVLMSAISYFGYRHYARPARVYEQLGTPVIYQEAGAGTPANEGRMIRVIRLIGEKVPISPADAGLTRKFLIAAGYRSDGAVSVYYGSKIVLALILLVVAFFVREYFLINPVYRILILVGAAGLGYIAPGWILDHLVSSRQETLKLSLPDALDLMVVSVEAGLGLDQAIVGVSRELGIAHKDISQELDLVTLEMRAGKRRSEALRNLAERTGVSEIKKLVAILIQTDRFGTSMADSLRTHSDYMRIRRRQEAEERAGKVGVKLVFPIFFCILPAMLMVVAGPGILQLVKHLFPMMRQFGQTGV